MQDKESEFLSALDVSLRVLCTELLKSNKGSVSGELFVRKIDVFTVFPMRFGRSAMLSKTKFSKVSGLCGP